jgi:hypothetical protein
MIAAGLACGSGYQSNNEDEAYEPTHAVLLKVEYNSFRPNAKDQRLATKGLSTPPDFIASPLHRLVRIALC